MLPRRRISTKMEGFATPEGRRWRRLADMAFVIDDSLLFGGDSVETIQRVRKL